MPANADRAGPDGRLRHDGGDRRILTQMPAAGKFGGIVLAESE